MTDRPAPATAGDAARGGPAVVVPPGTRLVGDAGLRLVDGGRSLLGGSPLRVLRLTEAGARVVTGWLAGAPVGTGAAASALARRLLDAGLVHPVPREGAGPAAADVTVVIPVRDDHDGLTATLAALATGPRPGRIVVVDDGSAARTRIDTALAGAGVSLVRRSEAGGPAAARNTGLVAVTTPLVAFLDAGVRTPPAWLAPLLGHLADAAVVAVAPRVRSEPGPTLLDRFERSCSPLDLGPEPARVAPGTRVSYLPTAALVVRRAALVEAGGFDEALRFGEDVDLVWRLAATGATVRYEPAGEVLHRPRRTWTAWAAQRAAYGTAAGPLARRHPGALAPVRVSPWSAAAWALLAARRPLPALAVVAGSTALLPRRLASLDQPWRTGVRLALTGHAGAGRLLGAGLTRAWWPLTAAAVLAWPPFRPVAAAAAVVPPLLEWRGQPRVDRIDVARYTALRLADDVAYGAGVWRGAWRARTVRPLVPDLGPWPRWRPRAVPRRPLPS